MNINEFSNEFDILLNSHLAETEFGKQDSYVAIKLDEYEKSVFLTKAHKSIVTDLYTGALGAPFESVEQNRRYLATYLKDYNKELSESDLISKYNVKCYNVTVPSDCMDILLEQAVINDDTCFTGRYMKVTPVTRDELNSVVNNPFRGITDRQILRMDSENSIELLTKWKLSSYYMSYIRRPKPIILVSLEGTDLSIDGLQEVTECEANPDIHQMILEQAVTMAIRTRINPQQNKTQNNNA